MEHKHQQGDGSVIRLTRVAPAPPPPPVVPHEARPVAAPAPRARESVRVGRTIWIATGAILAAIVAVILVGALVRVSTPGVSFSASTMRPDASPPPTDVVAAAGRLILLPDEAPTVATVSDMEPLRGQAFFERAQVGDVVLMYARAARAILYRPSADLIIEVAPIALDQ